MTKGIIKKRKDGTRELVSSTAFAKNSDADGASDVNVRENPNGAPPSESGFYSRRGGERYYSGRSANSAPPPVPPSPSNDFFKSGFDGRSEYGSYGYGGGDRPPRKDGSIGYDDGMANGGDPYGQNPFGGQRVDFYGRPIEKKRSKAPDVIALILGIIGVILGINSLSSAVLMMGIILGVVGSALVALRHHDNGLGGLGVTALIFNLAAVILSSLNVVIMVFNWW